MAEANLDNLFNDGYVSWSVVVAISQSVMCMRGRISKHSFELFCSARAFNFISLFPLLRQLETCMWSFKCISLSHCSYPSVYRLDWYATRTHTHTNFVIFLSSLTNNIWRHNNWERTSFAALSQHIPHERLCAYVSLNMSMNKHASSLSSATTTILINTDKCLFVLRLYWNWPWMECRLASCRFCCRFFFSFHCARKRFFLQYKKKFPRNNKKIK